MIEYSIEKIYGKYVLRKEDTTITVFDNGRHARKVCDLLNEQDERIKELESENKMLKTTISRNEAYIKRITTKGKWSNTGDVE